MSGIILARLQGGFTLDPLRSRMLLSFAALLTFIALVWLFARPAEGHHPRHDWWFDEARGGLTLELAEARFAYYERLADWAALEAANGPYVPRRVGRPQRASEPLSSSPPPAAAVGVDQWRSLVESYFPPERVEAALVVMYHESRGDPSAKNRTSSAAGLYQFLRSTWNRHAADLGFGDYDSGAPYVAEQSIAMAAYVSGLDRCWCQWGTPGVTDWGGARFLTSGHSW